MATKEKPRLQNFYEKEVVPRLSEELLLKNRMQVAKLKKIVINMGLGEAIQNQKAIESGRKSVELICGQKAVVTKARKSIATFKLREGMSIGVKVTLRKAQMWEFLDRLVNIALPRVRDFRGISSKFDGKGNCSLGIKEQIIFPEVDYDKIDKIRGLNISLITSAEDDKSGKALLGHLGMPFRK